MHSVNKKNKFLIRAAKIASTLFIAAVVLSPLQFLFSTTQTQGGDFVSSIQIESSVARAQVAACPPGYTRTVVNPSDTTGVCIDSKGSVYADPNSDLGIWFTNLIYIFTVGLMSSIAYVCAYFFNFAVSLSLQGPIYALDFISQGWTVVRDLANMSFIFILMYLAFTIILRAETSKTISTLAAVVVVAVLVNFSFFMTRIVVDVGNITAVQFYNLIPGEPMSQSSNPVPAAAGALTNGSVNNAKDLTASIMNALKIQNILNTESFKAFYNSQTGATGWLVVIITLTFIYIGIGIMFGILAGSFLFTGAKFIMRVVGLWFVIIASPLAFVAAAIEKKKDGKGSMYHMWQDTLIKYAFYPAIYLFMFYILTRFMGQLGTDCVNTGGNSCFIDGIFAGLPASNQTDAGFVTKIAGAMANVGIRLGFIVAMMYLALSVADKLVTQGSDYARSFSSKAGGFVAGGAIGFLGRQTLGRFGAANNIPALANRSYDPRNIPLQGKLIQAYSSATKELYKEHDLLPVDFGKPGVGKREQQFNTLVSRFTKPPNAPSQPVASAREQTQQNQPQTTKLAAPVPVRPSAPSTTTTPPQAAVHAPELAASGNADQLKLLKQQIKETKKLGLAVSNISANTTTTIERTIENAPSNDIKEGLANINTSLRDVVKAANDNVKRTPLPPTPANDNRASATTPITLTVVNDNKPKNTPPTIQIDENKKAA